MKRAARSLRPAQMRCLARPITAAQTNPTTGSTRSTTASASRTASMVDNIEDVDIVVGFLAETTRPHGFAISETQFHIFIINASRRLYSDRFFTSSFRPEFYSTFGLDWVMNNGPNVMKEEGNTDNGHQQTGAADEARAVAHHAGARARARERGQRLRSVGARPRADGEYYSLKWSPRGDAKDDPAFR